MDALAIDREQRNRLVAEQCIGWEPLFACLME